MENKTIASSTRKGMLLKLTGIAMYFLGFICFGIYLTIEDKPMLVALILGGFMGGFGFWGYKLFRRGKQHKAKTASDLLSSGTSELVLYLRSFVEDDYASRIVHQTFALFYVNGESEEEVLSSIFRKFGDCVAIGLPNEELPPLGMKRLYFSETEWQCKVLELMSRARVVIVRAGSTESLLWEMQQAIRLVKPERLLFLLPFPTNPAISHREAYGYNKFRLELEKLLPCKLPPFNGERPILGDLTGVLYFNHDWTPQVVNIVPLAGFARGLSVKTQLKKALKPFIKELAKVT